MTDFSGSLATVFYYNMVQTRFVMSLVWDTISAQ